MFALLNLISGLLETGAVIFALRHFGPAAALAAALLYQAGNLVPYPIRLSKRLTLCFAALAGAGMAAGAAVPVCTLAAVPLLSASVQATRAGMKTNARKQRKRVVRMAGFLLGFVFHPLLGVACAVIAAAAASTAAPDVSAIHVPRFKKLHAVMILHQMHYFSYCYSVMITAYSFGGVLPAVGLFFAGWLAYVFSPCLYTIGRNYKHLFVLGHVWLTVSLTALYFVPSPAVKACLWLLSGFGGTTEFCVGKLAQQRGTYDASSHNSAEACGHIAGTAGALAVFWLTKDSAAPVLLGAAAAACAAVTMLSLASGSKQMRGGEEILCDGLLYDGILKESGK